MTERLRIGTRGSPLALAQTALVVRALTRHHPAGRWEVVPLRTAGDRTRRRSGSLDFTDEIDRRLETGEVDLAVHSAKDLPARPTRSVRPAAYLRRGDPRDCLVSRAEATFETLPRRGRVGSSSLRRRAQILARRPDLTVVPVRGNIGTRLEQLERAKLDGLILAAAGLARLGWAGRIRQYFPSARWLPAPGQGAIAVEVRRGDRSAARAVAPLDHGPTHAAVDAERNVVAALGGDCNLPLGAFAVVRARRLWLRAALYSPDGRRAVTAERAGSADRAESIGTEVGRTLERFELARGGRAVRPVPLP